MGWLSHSFHNLKHKVKRINWADVADKGKRGWTMGTQILGFARSVIPKMKQYAQVVSLVPSLGENAQIAIKGLERAESFLTRVDRARQRVEGRFPSLARNSPDNKMKGLPYVREAPREENIQSNDIYALD